MVDIYGSTSSYDDFWKRTSQCRYRADRSLKNNIAIDALRRGPTIKLEEVETDRGEKVLYEVSLNDPQPVHVYPC